MAEQLSFDLPVRPALGRDDFFVSEANAMAVALVENWPNWSSGKLVISGPVGSGKTHLVHVWANLSGGHIIDATELMDADIPSLAAASVAVENVHLIAQVPKAQDALFHLHNLVLAEGNTLLLTGVDAPKYWGLTLPDLASRMQGTMNATLSDPDDMLLSVLLAKLFNDRQLIPTPDTIPFLVKNIDRSYAAARALVEDLDRASLSEKKPITRAFASRFLRNQAG